MSKFIAIANDSLNSKANVAIATSGKDSKILLGEPVDYTVNRDYMSLSRAIAELDVLEGTLAALFEEGYKGKVFITCHKGLALKISAASAGREIYQDFMDTADGPWGEYVARIKDLVAESKKAGMVLSGTPSLNLRRSEIEISGAYELTEDDGVKIGQEIFHDGDEVVFNRVSKSGEAYRAEAGAFVSTDVFVHGKRELHIVAGSDGRAYINVVRFNEDTEDKLPDTAYGDQISWLRYATQAARASLREGRAPKKAETAA